MPALKLPRFRGRVNARGHWTVSLDLGWSRKDTLRCYVARDSESPAVIVKRRSDARYHVAREEDLASGGGRVSISS